MIKAASQIRLDEKLFAQVKFIAERELRTMNAQMEYFIRLGVERYKRDNRLSEDDLLQLDELE